MLGPRLRLLSFKTWAAKNICLLPEPAVSSSHNQKNANTEFIDFFGAMQTVANLRFCTQCSGQGWGRLVWQLGRPCQCWRSRSNPPWHVDLVVNRHIETLILVKTGCYVDMLIEWWIDMLILVNRSFMITEDNLDVQLISMNRTIMIKKNMT